MNCSPGRRALLAAASVLVLASGCAASATEPTPEPVPSTAPNLGDGVTSLAELGVDNGPAAWTPLPADISVGEVVDQENVVTLIVLAPEGEQFIDFLDQQLPAAGFSIESASKTGLVFSGYGWTGGATTGEATALTLRRDQD
ncbi:hypothetical protein [Naumannella halotolerans]|uniref:Secreted protein n=1 Tax=Naumannella halotolerans TaxID=993414 RepID=A0A4R7J9Z0_9ACTN|nr:hypothetical protein [Naumannella halotolerans]TDT34124.1 hypothetical protein CLV29_1777 [Naumannella halotolerans]